MSIPLGEFNLLHLHLGAGVDQALDLVTRRRQPD